MPRSTQVHLDHKQAVRLALERNGFLTQGDLAAHLDIALSTVNNFFNCKRVYVSKFEEICDALKLDKQKITQPIQAAQPSEAITDPSPPETCVYDPETWVGRDSLLKQLLDILKQQTRLVWLTGISGVGKTTLGECLAVRAWDETKPFDWISYEIPIASENQNFTVSAAALLETYLGDTDLDPQERNDPKRLSDRLLRQLQSHPYWIQVDSIERLLNTESSAFADEYWLTFLQHCLTHPDFPSRLVLTSQALPASMLEWRDRYPNRWHETTLRGLLVTEQQNERLEFFSKNGIPAENSESWLDRIAEIYEGHPLVLRVIAGEIRQNYSGDVAQYWVVNHQEFEQVARELQDKRLDEIEYNDLLDRQVRERVKKSLEQLPPDALDLLCRSAVYRRPVPKPFWLAMIADRSAKQQKEAYRVLGDRALVEQEGIHQGQFLIRQHNLIRDIAYDLLKQDVAIWENAERQAAHLWLTAYESTPNAPKLETIRGYLEASNHYWQVKDYQKVIALPHEKLETGHTVSRQLFIWSYFQELLELHTNALKAACDIGDRQGEGKALGNLGTAYYSLGNYQQSIASHQQHLTIAREIDDRQGEGAALGSLGNAYFNLGNYSQAIELYQQHLTIAREIDDRQGEGATLGNLGNAYFNLGNYSQAIELYQQHLTIAREIDDRRGEGIALGCLGIAYDSLGNYQQAIDFHQQYLAIAREIGDRQGEGNALGNLGLAYDSLGNYQQAIDSHQQALVISREIGDRQGEGATLGNLGIAYDSLGNYQQAIDFHQQYLAIAREIGNRQGEGIALVDWGHTLIKLERYSEALERLQHSLEIFREIGDRPNEAEALLRLAELHQKTGSIASGRRNANDLAKQYCDRALGLAIELGIPLAEECRSLRSELDKEVRDDESRKD